MNEFYENSHQEFVKKWRSDNLLKFRQELFDTVLNFGSFKKVYEDKENHVTTKSIK